MPAPSSSSCEAGNDAGLPAVHSQPPPATVSQLPGSRAGTTPGTGTSAGAGAKRLQSSQEGASTSQGGKAARGWSHASPSADAVTESRWQATLEVLSAGASPTATPVGGIMLAPTPAQPQALHETSTQGAATGAVSGSSGGHIPIQPGSHSKSEQQALPPQQRSKAHNCQTHAQPCSESQPCHLCRSVPSSSTAAAAAASSAASRDMAPAAVDVGIQCSSGDMDFTPAAATSSASGAAGGVSHATPAASSSTGAAGVPDYSTAATAAMSESEGGASAAPRKKLNIRIKTSKNSAQQQPQQPQPQQHVSLPADSNQAPSGSAAGATSSGSMKQKIVIRIKTHSSKTDSGSPSPSAASTGATGHKRGAESDPDEADTATSSCGDSLPAAKKSRQEGSSTADGQQQQGASSAAGKSCRQRLQEAVARDRERQRQKRERLYALAMQLPGEYAWKVLCSRAQGYEAPLKNLVYPPANGKVYRKIRSKKAAAAEEEEEGGDNESSAALPAAQPHRSRLSYVTYA